MARPPPASASPLDVIKAIRNPTLPGAEKRFSLQLHVLLRELAGQAARALGPQIRLHGHSATKAWQKAESDPADPVIPLSPLVGVLPDSAVSDDDDDDDDDDAEQRRHDGFLATAALILAGAPIGDWQILRAPATAELEDTFAGSARGTLKLLGSAVYDRTRESATEIKGRGRPTR
jgi:hypothetical protein